jgi:hypothetical protein
MEQEGRPEPSPEPQAVLASGDAPGGTAATDRDPDLVTLEGLESELADLDAELARVERADGAKGATSESEAARPPDD